MASGPGLDVARARRVLAAGDRDTAVALCLDALTADPDDLPALCLLGRLRAAAGDLTEAESLARRAVDRAPDDADGHYTLALALDAGGRRKEALACLVTALGCNPDHAPACAAAGRMLAAAGRLEQAVASLDHALSLDPANKRIAHDLAHALVALARRQVDAGSPRLAVDGLVRAAGLCDEDASSQLRIGVSLQRLGAFDAAERCYRCAAALSPSDAHAHSNLGTLAQARREPDAALDHYRRALELAPGHSEATAGVAAILDWQGRYDDAMALVRPCIDSGDRGIEMLLMYGKLARRTGAGDEALARLVPLVEIMQDRPADVQRLSFVIADLLEDAGRHDSAFHWYERGNRLKDARFDRGAHADAVDALVRSFRADALAAAPVSHRVDERPVFIVGMPRSGTSLVEQMLAAHPSVHAGGELTALSDLVLGLEAHVGSPYPDCVAGLSAEDLATLADRYLAAFGEPSPAALRLTDKTPNNFLHLGLVQRMLPGARIVHCRRDARDVALSCYFQNFAGDGIPFSYDLGDIGHYYADYRRLMAHYAKVSDLPVLDLDYESLVARPETEVRRLLDFLGLPYDAACLAFHRLSRVATTASHAQVRKPVYTGSVHRYRRHAGALAPFIEAIGPDLASELEACP